MLVSYCPARAVAKIACRRASGDQRSSKITISSFVPPPKSLRCGVDIALTTHPCSCEQVQRFFQTRHVELALEHLVARPEHLVLLVPGGVVGLKGMSELASCILGPALASASTLSMVWRMVAGNGPRGSFEAIDGNPAIGRRGSLCRRLSRRDRCSLDGRHLGRRGRDVETDATFLTLDTGSHQESGESCRAHRTMDMRQ